MTHGSEIKFHGVATRDAELAITPGGTPVKQFDMALDVDGRTVYVPVRIEGELARQMNFDVTRGESYMVWGYLWRPARTAHVPYPKLMVVVNGIRPLRKAQTGDLFEAVSS